MGISDLVFEDLALEREPLIIFVLLIVLDVLPVEEETLHRDRFRDHVRLLKLSITFALLASESISKILLSIYIKKSKQQER